jgi:CheY-like chemotaxis protein
MVKIPIRVLVVDDEKDFVEMLSLRLNESGQDEAGGLRLPAETGRF